MSDTQKHTKPNVPNLRFPGFEGEWTKSTLKKECTINPKTEGLEKEFLYIDLESVVKGQLVKHNIISRDEAPSRAQRVLSKWDILYQCVRPYQLNNFIIRDDSDIQRVASTGYAQIRTKHNPDFIYQLLHTKSFTDQVINRCTGTNYPAINSSDLSGIEICIPCIQEQANIGKLLSLIDQRIAFQNKVIKGLISIKESTTKTLLNTHDIPGRVVTLGEITEVITRRNKQRIVFPMYSVTNDRGFIPQSEQFEDREMVGEDIAAYKIIHNGEIAYNPARINVGSIAQYTEESPCMISSLYVCIKARPGVLGNWLIQVLRSEQLINYYNLYAEGGVRLYLFYPNFSKIKVFLPSLERQKKVANALEAIEEKIRLESSLLASYQQAKQAILSKMFI